MRRGIKVRISGQYKAIGEFGWQDIAALPSLQNLQHPPAEHVSEIQSASEVLGGLGLKHIEEDKAVRLLTEANRFLSQTR